MSTNPVFSQKESMKRRVYIETSVISYLTAKPSKTIIGAAHQQITLAWWDKKHEYELFISDAVLNECAGGDAQAAEKRVAAVVGLPLLAITEDALNIASALVERGIVPKKAAEDALHIALATVHGMDYLLTWNCRHIANMEIQRSIAGYLESQGFLLPIMCTPEELLGDYDVE
jgi:predicted nucleic acid-binding protein